MGPVHPAGDLRTPQQPRCHRSLPDSGRGSREARRHPQVIRQVGAWRVTLGRTGIKSRVTKQRQDMLSAVDRLLFGTSGHGSRSVSMAEYNVRRNAYCERLIHSPEFTSARSDPEENRMLFVVAVLT